MEMFASSIEDGLLGVITNRKHTYIAEASALVIFCISDTI